MTESEQRHERIGPDEPDDLEPEPCACLTRPCTCEAPWDDAERHEPDEEREPEDAGEAREDMPQPVGGAPSPRAEREQQEAAGAPSPSGPPAPRALPGPAVPPPSWRVEGLAVEDDEGRYLIPPGKVTFLGGKGGTGKTRTARAIFRDMAEGRRALDKYYIRNPGPVLVVVGNSDDPAGWQALAAAHPIVIVASVKETDYLDTATGQKHVGSLAAKHRPVALVVDSITSCSTPGRDENDTRKAATIMEFLAGLSVEHGLTILPIHHARKNLREDEDPLDFLRGTTAFANACEMALHFRRHGRKNCSTITPVTKRNSVDDLVPPFLVEHRDDRTVWLQEYDPEREEDNRLIALVAEHEGATIAVLRRASGDHYTTTELRERLRLLVEREDLVREGYTYYTAAGREQAKAQAEAEARDLEARAKPIASLLLDDPAHDEHVELLLALARSAGPLSREAVGEAIDMSERTVSRRLEELREAVPEPLVVARQGEGLRLTSLGRAVAAKLEALQAEAAARWEEAARELGLEV